MKIKDLDPNKSLGGVRFRYPGDGQLYYWHSQWQKGVWGKTRMTDSQVFPLHCDDLRDAMEWEVVPVPESPNEANAISVEAESQTVGAHGLPKEENKDALAGETLEA